MSTRWYPIYQRGNPQLRVFLPNFWLKMVRPKHPQPKNVVQFECSMEMTQFDIKNYLEKIYNVKVASVRTWIHIGKLILPQNIKCEDKKIAIATLPKDVEFEFPNYFDKDLLKPITESTEQDKKKFEDYVKRSKVPTSVPWFRNN